MWEYLGSIPWKYSVIIIALVILSALIFLFRGGLISFGDKIFKIGIKEKDLPHHKCPYNSDFKRLMMKTIETMAKYFEIKNVKVLEEQMAMVEEQSTFIYSMFMSAYNKVLVEKTGKKETHDHPDYCCYKNLLTILYEQSIKTLLRNAFKQNNILDKSEDEFRVYANEKIKLIFQLGEMFLDGYYHLNIITRIELKQINQGIRETLTSFMFDIFYKARKIAYENNENAQKLLDNLHSYCDDLCGVTADLNEV